MEVTLEIDKMDKLIITVATTGGIHTKSVNPNLPEQPDEIAQDVYDCYNAGATGGTQALLPCISPRKKQVLITSPHLRASYQASPLSKMEVLI